jgi:hypothetical protein
MGFCKIRKIALNQINLRKVSPHPQRKKQKKKLKVLEGVFQFCKNLHHCNLFFKGISANLM